MKQRLIKRIPADGSEPRLVFASVEKLEEMGLPERQSVPLLDRKSRRARLIEIARHLGAQARTADRYLER